MSKNILDNFDDEHDITSYKKSLQFLKYNVISIVVWFLLTYIIDFDGYRPQLIKEYIYLFPLSTSFIGVYYGLTSISNEEKTPTSRSLLLIGNGLILGVFVLIAYKDILY